MKLNDIINKDTSSQMIQQYQRGEKLNQPVENKSVSPAATEKVDISERAKDIQQARNIIAGTPDVREDKIKELKAQVDQGIYKVNTDKLAKKMVNESLIDIFA